MVHKMRKYMKQESQDVNLEGFTKKEYSYF